MKTKRKVPGDLEQSYISISLLSTCEKQSWRNATKQPFKYLFIYFIFFEKDHTAQPISKAKTATYLGVAQFTRVQITGNLAKVAQTDQHQHLKRTDQHRERS
jgi:hypothetical protein